MRYRSVTHILASLLLLACFGCSSGGETITGTPETTDSTTMDQVADRVAPDSAPELFGPDLPEDPDDLLSDISPDEGGGPACAPGEGCFLDPCSGNSDCQSGWCVEHMGEDVCTQLCQEECPPGWACKPVGSGGPDLTYICVSAFSNLCKPCTTSEGCKAIGGADDVCVDYGVEGSFCGGTCTTDADCPWGFSCGEAVTVNGISTWQCVAESGVCPCTQKSVTLALTTPCEVTNDFGTCTGQRVCTEEGLSACDADEPQPETCNGLDDDCDGEVDEPDLVEGEYVSLCNDDNPCTKDSCTGETGCEHESLAQGECVDGDACTMGDHCESGVCVGTPIECDDNNPCTDDACDGVGGCAFKFNMADCDDGDPCTVADQCDEGLCLGVAVPCDCQSDADCEALEDGDLCNGTLVCDTDQLPYKCAIDPATIVVCPPPEGPDAFCLQATCAPETGQCSLAPDHEGYFCDDGNACTIGDTCQEGVCEPGTAALCADNNPCTDDSCDPATGCLYSPNTAPCNDGDVCTTQDGCQDGQCVGGPALGCDDGNPCTDDACDPQTGCSHAANQQPCDDDNACTANDQCKLGACLPGPAVNCDDDNECTADSCLPDSGCLHQFIEGGCEDGDPCTAGDTCINGVCQPGGPLDCDDGNPCTDDSCAPDGSCLHTANQAACDDGNACTVGDHCQDSACTYSGLANCDDGNLCTTDSCHPEDGCIHLLNSVPCDDEDACTTGDYCHLGECIGKNNLLCDDANPCTDDACDPAIGCVHTPNQEACDDGNACTTGDSCSDGQCTYSGLTDCDDDNICTTDACDPDQGCLHQPNSNLCTDGSVCTIGDHCADGSCVPGANLECDDGNPCTDDACDPVAGCLNVPNDALCDDNNVCTVDDVCAEGGCTSLSSLDCDDANVCTVDTCDPVAGCQHAPLDSLCDDDNVCTEDGCDPVEGCQHVPLDANCDDDNACTVDTCDPIAGCQNTPDDAACDDGNVCTDDACDPATGCFHTNNNAACDDGSNCTVNDHCANGQCTGTVGTIKLYDSDFGVGTLLSCGGGHDGFNFACHFKGYGDTTGNHPTGDYQGSTWCWAVGEADGHVNEKYTSCGGGCTHWAYIECYLCNQ